MFLGFPPVFFHGQAGFESRLAGSGRDCRAAFFAISAKSKRSGGEAASTPQQSGAATSNAQRGWDAGACSHGTLLPCSFSSARSALAGSGNLHLPQMRPLSYISGKNLKFSAELPKNTGRGVLRPIADTRSNLHHLYQPHENRNPSRWEGSRAFSKNNRLQ